MVSQFSALFGVFLRAAELLWTLKITQCHTVLETTWGFSCYSRSLGPKTGAKLLEAKSQQHMKWKPISGFLSSPRSKQQGQGIAFLVDSLSLIDSSLFAVSLTWSEDVLAHCRGVGLHELERSLATKTIPWFYIASRKQCLYNNILYSVFITTFSLGLASGSGGKDARQFWCSWYAYLKMAHLSKEWV